MAAPTELESRISQRTLDALILALSVHPEGTKFRNVLTSDLMRLFQEDKKRAEEYGITFTELGYSRKISDGVSSLGFIGVLSFDFSINAYVTKPELYECKNDESFSGFSEEDRTYLENLGKRLETIS